MPTACGVNRVAIVAGVSIVRVKIAGVTGSFRLWQTRGLDFAFIDICRLDRRVAVMTGDGDSSQLVLHTKVSAVCGCMIAMVTVFGGGGIWTRLCRNVITEGVNA